MGVDREERWEVKASRQGVTGVEGILVVVGVGEGRWRVRLVRRRRVVRLEGGIHPEVVCGCCWGSGKLMSVLVGVGKNQVCWTVPE